MIYKSKARYEGAGVSGVTRIIQATDKAIATNFGTFVKRDCQPEGDWSWVLDHRVKLFPVVKESKQ